MKKLMVLTAMVFSVLTAVEPVWAQDNGATVSTKLQDESTPTRLSDLPMHVNPQIGLSSFDYSGQSSSNSKQKLTAGATLDFGGPARRLETGLLFMQTGANANINQQNVQIDSSYLTIPMMAKLRVVTLPGQSWYTKVGFMTAFELNSNHSNDTNKIDVLGSLGVGDRLAFNRRSDLILEASFNRGLMGALSSSSSSYNEGFLFLAGMSFSI